MKELIVAKEAAKKAGALILKYHGKNFKVRHKGEIDLVTEVDVKAQQKICKVIQKSFPKDAILAEEEGFSTTAKAKRRWIIDPIDGTTNFAHGYPMFCVSIAFEKNNRVQCGVVYDPTRDEMFYAQKNKGAFLGKKRLKASKTSKLKDSLLVTGFPYLLHDFRRNNLPLFNEMMFRCQAVRRDGTAALNLAYVAAGYFDGFWELGLSPWDCAAGVLLIKEAGGQIKLFDESEPKDYPGSFVAGNKKITKKLFEDLSEIRSRIREPQNSPLRNFAH